MTTDSDRVSQRRNVPPAQRLLREGGICSCYWRLPGGRPVLCGLPSDEPHDHFLPPEPRRGTWMCRTFGHAYRNRATSVINTTRWMQPTETPVTVVCRRCGDRP